MRFKRRRTTQVLVGGVKIGGEAPVTIQSMLSVPTTDVDAALRQINELTLAGCDIIRVALPDSEAVEAFRVIRSKTDAPLVADIHFDYRIALAAADAGADKLRINPGNIGSAERVAEVARAARGKGIPIRVGVNAGSLPKDLRGTPTPEKLVEAARMEIDELISADFDRIVVSLKSRDPVITVEANRLFSERFDLPLHIGVTEAGLPGAGTIRGSVGIGTMLLEGIGDTVRVSLTGDPVEEVRTARHILTSCGLLESGIELVSCPTCGRCKVDVESIARRVSESLPATEGHMVVAVMGCEVNGPGEARAADIGIAGGDGFFTLFKKGKVIGKIAESEAVETLLAEIERFIAMDRGE